MRVMYFGFEGFDNPNGTNHLAISLIDEMLKNEIDVYLLNSHTKGIDPDIPEILLNRERFDYQIINRSNVNKRNFIQRYFDGICYAFKAMKYWKKEKMDVILYQSTPTAIFSIVLLKLFKRKPIVYSLYDVFPENARAVNAINKYVYFILKFIQKIVYACCDKIIVISEDMKNQMINLGIKEEKLEIVRLWYDESQINIENHENFFHKLNPDIDINKFILQYAGNIGFTFDYKMIIYLAERLIEYKDIEFHVIGDGAFLTDFKKTVMEKNLKNIVFFGWQSSSIIYDVYKSCSIEIVPLANEVIKNAYPSKTSLLMACEKSFICTTEKDSSFYKEINNNQVGICIDKNDRSLVVDTIIDLYNNKEKLIFYNANAKKYSEKLLSKSYNCDKFIKIIKKL